MFLKCSCSDSLERMCDSCEKVLLKCLEENMAAFGEIVPGYKLVPYRRPECLNCNDTGTAIVYGGPARPCSCSKGDKY